MTESFHIAYQLHDAGWASVTVKYGEESHQQAVSYLYDSLKDLCNLALTLQSGASITEAKVLFLEIQLLKSGKLEMKKKVDF